MKWVNAMQELPAKGVEVLCHHVRSYGEYFKVMCINADGEWQGEDDLRPKDEIVTHWMQLPDAPNV